MFKGRKKEHINIVLCGDLNVEVGLHVTLYSLLEKSSCPFHKIYFINRGYSDKHIESLNKTLVEFQKKYELILLSYDENVFGNYKPLHGNRFAYTKLVIADLIQEDIVLYLDMDLVINLDIKELASLDIKDFIIAANPEYQIFQSLEHRLYSELGLKGEEPYFNTGVMIINLKKWREQEITTKCINFANNYNKYLQTADQTVLNYVCHGNFYQLENRFNTRLGNEKHLTPNDKLIFHFFGRPKLWNLFVNRLNPNYSIFDRVFKKTHLFQSRAFKKDNLVEYILVVRQYKSYIKLILRLKV
jgi:lipopolysaccharide biosynthesis glycosyltransferase